MKVSVVNEVSSARERERLSSLFSEEKQKKA